MICKKCTVVQEEPCAFKPTDDERGWCNACIAKRRWEFSKMQMLVLQMCFQKSLTTGDMPAAIRHLDLCQEHVDGAWNLLYYVKG